METRQLEFKNRHGKRMPATLRLPEGESRGTFVMLHGLGGWKDQEIVSSVSLALAESGYAALAFDAADGACGPDGSFFTSTTSLMYEDLQDVVASLEKESWHAGPVSLAGHSQGGLVALRLAAESNVEKLILVAPAVNWLSAFRSARAYGFALVVWTLAWLTRGLSNWNGPEGKTLRIGRAWLFDFFRWNGFRYGKMVRASALIVSAGEDRTVATVHDHARLARTLGAQHAVVPGAPHHFAKESGKATDIVKQWLTSS